MTTEELKVFRQEKLDDFIDTYLASVKAHAGYMEEITAFDGEIRDLMGSAVMDMLTAGVPADMFDVEDSNGEEIRADDRILLAVSCYVQAYIGQDRSDTNRYLNLYKSNVRKLSTEDGGAWDVEPNN